MKRYDNKFIYWFLLTFLFIFSVAEFNLVLAMYCIPLLALPFIIFILKEFGEHQKKLKDTPLEERKKLEIIGTLPYSNYVNNYMKKLLVLLLLSIAFAFGWYIIIKYDNNILVESGIYRIIIISLIVILLIHILIKNYFKTENAILKMKKYIEQKYPSYIFTRINENEYSFMDEHHERGNYERISSNFLVEIKEINFTLKDRQHYIVKRNGTSYIGTKLFLNYLEYSYYVNKKINCDTKDFSDVVELNSNNELVYNAIELNKSRYLNFKIENNILTIEKIIKNKSINKKDCIDNLNDIEIFKTKIVDVINK